MEFLLKIRNPFASSSEFRPKYRQIRRGRIGGQYFFGRSGSRQIFLAAVDILSDVADLHISLELFGFGFSFELWHMLPEASRV